MSKFEKTFTGGNPLKADELNKMAAAINDNDDQIASLRDDTNTKIYELYNNLSDNIAHNVVDTNDDSYIVGKIINSSGGYYSDTYSDYVTTGYIPCVEGMKFRPARREKNFTPYVCFFNADKTAIPSAFINRSLSYIEVPSDTNIAYMRVSMEKNTLNGCMYNSSLTINTVVGYNEVVIKSDAVDGTKYVIVDDRLTMLESYVNSHQFEIIENIFDNTQITKDKYVNPKTGVVESSTGIFITDYIPCKYGDVLVWQNKLNSLLCAFYDSNKTFLRGYYDNDLNPFNTIPNIKGLTYVRFSVPISYLNLGLYKASKKVPYFVKYGEKAIVIDDVFLGEYSLNDISKKVIGLEESTIKYVSNINDTNDEYFIKNRLVNSIGEYYEDTYIGYATTGYIACKSGDVFRLVNGIRSQLFVCYFNDVKKSIPSLYSNSTVDTLIVPNDDSVKFVRIGYKRINTIDDCIYKTDKVIPYAIDYGIKIHIVDNMISDNISVDSIIANDIRIDGESIFGQVNWQYACGRIICIGDSLTDGLYVPNSQGQYTQGLINENYPYFLGRMLNAEVFNAGKNGSYPSKFYAGEGSYPAWYPQIDFTKYDSVMLWLGTNGGLNTANEYAAAFTPEKEGWYYKQIIDGIKSQNPTIKITLGKVFITGEIESGVTHANVDTTNAFIDSVANEYGLQVIDFSDLSVNKTLDLRNGINNTHFGKAGNIFIADRICQEWKSWFKENYLRCEFGLTTKQPHNP